MLAWRLERKFDEYGEVVGDAAFVVASPYVGAFRFKAGVAVVGFEEEVGFIDGESWSSVFAYGWGDDDMVDGAPTAVVFVGEVGGVGGEVAEEAGVAVGLGSEEVG